MTDNSPKPNDLSEQQKLNSEGASAKVARSDTAGSHGNSIKGEQYWRANLRLILLCLFFWFLLSFVAGIFLVETLNHISLGGYPLGFWFAQQGSIIGFILLIIFYNRRVKKLESKYQ